MKYIDAEKVIAEIKRYKNKADNRLKIKGRTFSKEQKDLALQNLCGNLLHFIDSLQQERPEVDLEKEIDFFLYGTYTPERFPNIMQVRDEHTGFKVNDWKWWVNNPEYKVEFARHFYELGLNTRK